MIISYLNPYDFTVKRYPPNERALHICDTSISSFTVLLPDASSVRHMEFFFQKDHDSNVLYISAQFGQSIQDTQVISLYGRGQTVHLVSDGENYRLIAGMVPEIPVTLPLGRYWRERPNGFDLDLEKDIGLGTGTWQVYDSRKMEG